MAFLTQNQLAFLFGLSGNILSFLVFLAPIPTFYKICKKKTSEGFHSIPYVIALLSAMLLLYYGVLKTNANLIVSINIIGCVIEVIYLTLHLLYASRKSKMHTLKMLLLLNVGIYGTMMVFTIFVLKGKKRLKTIGMICAIFNVAVFAAPLSIMKKVIKTKSVEYLPFTLSFFLTLSAISWFFHGFFIKDPFIALPNVLGFLFGVVQMILYVIYKDFKNGSKHTENNIEAQTTNKAPNCTNNDDQLKEVKTLGGEMLNANYEV